MTTEFPDDTTTGWPVSPANPAVASFTALMTAAMEIVMVAQFQRRSQLVRLDQLGE